MKLASKFLAILLAALLAFGLSAPVMAAEGEAEETAITAIIAEETDDPEDEGLPAWAVWLITIFGGGATAIITWLLTNGVIWLTPFGLANAAMVVLTLLISPLLLIAYSFVLYIVWPAAAGSGIGYLIHMLLG